jgi:hexosaminidase
MLLSALAVALSLAGPTQAKPPTIPALRHWQPAAGSFEPARSTRVVGPGAEAKLLARELKRPLAPGAVAGAGDIELRLGSRDRRLGSEGYRLDIGTSVRLEARTTTGLFYGTRTLLQLLRRGDRLPAGSIRDWPRYPERGLMLDNGRRYFTPAWIKRRIDLLAYLKLNQLHLHFSDNEGFRIESESHPEVVSKRHLTKRQVRDLIAYAARRHVRVIPELDMPGHLRTALAKHPELQLPGAPDKLDIRKPAARRFCRELIEEYLELFPGEYWHAGADEYGGASTTAYVNFINWIDRLVRSHGRTLRIWHDGLKPGARLNRDVVVEWWADHAGPTPRQLLRQGHRVLNAGWFPTYYVAGGPLSRVHPSMKIAYERWEVNLFGGLAINSPTPGNPFQRVPARNVLGSELHVWNDVPPTRSDAEIARGIAPRLRVLAQKTWDTRPPAPDYAGFERIWRSVTPPPGRPRSRRR